MSVPQAVRLEKLGTVLLGVRDSGKSVAFYRDMLGLAVQFSSGEFTFLDGGGVTIALRPFVDLKDESDERRVELVFHVPDIDAAHAALEARGVRFGISPRIVTGEIYAAAFRDPDGHVLSIFGPRAG